MDNLITRFRSWIVLMPAGLIAIGLAVGVSFLFPWSSIPYWAVDFTVFYAAASAVAHGADPYVWAQLARYVPPDTVNPVLSYSYPPLLALLLVPLTALPLDTAARLWLAFNLLAPGISIGMLLVGTAWKPSPIQLAILLLGSILFLPCLYTYLSGQASLWSLFWASAGILLMSRGGRLAAGMSWAAAWAKPHPLFLVPLELFFRNRRGLIVFIGVLLTSLGLAAMWLPSWPNAVIGAFEANANAQEILYQATALGALSYFGPTGLIIRGAVGMAAIGLLAILARKKTDWRTFTIAQLSLGLLVAPYMGRSDVAIALIPILLILTDRRTIVRPARIVAVGAWCSPYICALLRVSFGIDWLLLPLVWGGLTQWMLALASAWYVKIALQHFDNSPSTQ